MRTGAWVASIFVFHNNTARAKTNNTQAMGIGGSANCEDRAAAPPGTRCGDNTVGEVHGVGYHGGSLCFRAMDPASPAEQHIAKQILNHREEYLTNDVQHRRIIFNDRDTDWVYLIAQAPGGVFGAGDGGWGAVGAGRGPGPRRAGGGPERGGGSTELFLVCGYGPLPPAGGMRPARLRHYVFTTKNLSVTGVVLSLGDDENPSPAEALAAVPDRWLQSCIHDEPSAETDAEPSAEEERLRDSWAALVASHEHPPILLRRLTKGPSSDRMRVGSLVMARGPRPGRRGLTASPWLADERPAGIGQFMLQTAADRYHQSAALEQSIVWERSAQDWDTMHQRIVLNDAPHVELQIVSALDSQLDGPTKRMWSDFHYVLLQWGQTAASEIQFTVAPAPSDAAGPIQSV